MNWLQAILADRATDLSGLASAIGRTRNTLYNWRTGKTSPRSTDLTALSELLGVPADVLLQRISTKTGGNEMKTIANRIAEIDAKIEELARSRAAVDDARAVALARGDAADIVLQDKSLRTIGEQIAALAAERSAIAPALAYEEHRADEARLPELRSAHERLTESLARERARFVAAEAEYIAAQRALSEVKTASERAWSAYAQLEVKIKKFAAENAALLAVAGGGTQ